MKKQIDELVIFLAVILVFAQFCTAQNLVVNSGFETPEITGWGWPSTYGDWGGDYSLIVSASEGIVPLEGSQMLNFIATGWESWAHSSAVACQVPQIIDISQFKNIITAGEAIASASAYFNRVAGDAQTDTRFWLRIWAHEGNPNSYPTQREHNLYLDMTDTNVITDGDLATWERCEAELALPPNTGFLVVEVIADENVFNDLSAPEFDGHYADAVSLTIIPEPATLLLVGLSAVMLRRRHR